MRALPMLILLAVLGCMAPRAALAGIEQPFLYHPRPYPDDADRRLPPHVVTLGFQTSAGQQYAYYVPPRDRRSRGGVPERLWICFGGNASLALDWLPLAEVVEKGTGNRGAGYLLVEYPGYGRCSGTPSASAILESSQKAFEALAAHLRVEPEHLQKRMGLIGYSLGTAAALQFAVHHPVDRLILVAPFTSIRAMASRWAGFLGSLIVEQQFDNVACLRRLAARERPPRITLIHGAKDTVVPVGMGRALAELYPEMIRFVEIPQGDHLTIFKYAGRTLFEAMRP